jgi:3-hydroxymyristoyl/3-hydroxydecanoyl-(acyl carrier protein) dehydratase|tara:strand:+ start:1521 stop:1664 length:144 start_codon:yes stop_codon:yes gene_type:complete
MKKNSLNVDEIIEYLEITPPFLMIDSVEKIIPGKSCCRYEELASIYL